MAALNAPHPTVWLDAMRNNPRKKQRAATFVFFQIPYLPEFLISLNHAKALPKGFFDSTRRGAFRYTFSPTRRQKG